MGLVGKIVCGALIVGSFFVGRITYQTGLKEVYRFIDRNPQQTEKVFTYTWDKLQVTDPSFLNSYGNTLTEDQKKQIAEDYIKQKLSQAYDKGKQSVEKISKDISNLLSNKQ
jgi:hypothetical protein